MDNIIGGNDRIITAHIKKIISFTGPNELVLAEFECDLVLF
jgi:hypothetical protein